MCTACIKLKRAQMNHYMTGTRPDLSVSDGLRTEAPPGSHGSEAEPGQAARFG